MVRSRDQLLALWDQATRAVSDPALQAELQTARADLVAQLPGPAAAPMTVPAVALTPTEQALVTLAGNRGNLELVVQGKVYWINITPRGKVFSIFSVYGPAYDRRHRMLAGGGNLERSPSPTVRRVLTAVQAHAEHHVSAEGALSSPREG